MTSAPASSTAADVRAWHVCTIAARNYVPSVELLARSFRERHRTTRLSALILDASEDDVFAGLSFDVIKPTDLVIGSDEFARMATYYDVTELSTALKPFLLAQLLAEGAEVAMYLDPDIEVFAPLDDLFELALEHQIALTPHVTRPVPRDGLDVSEEAFLLSGQFNLGFIAVSHEAGPFLDYWKERTRMFAISDTASGYFTDQRWIDAVPALFEHIVVRDPGCNVAYWNLHERQVDHCADGWTVNGVLLRFFHFSGHDPRTPEQLSRHITGPPRVRVEDEPHLRELLRARAVRLVAAGWSATPAPYRWERTGMGMSLDHFVRRCYWRGVRGAEDAGVPTPPHAFGDDRGHAFANWLREPIVAESAVSRHLFFYWEHRADLRTLFPDPLGADGERFMSWARSDADFTSLVPPALRPPVSHPTPGVNLVGYLTGEFGVASAGRMVARA